MTDFDSDFELPTEEPDSLLRTRVTIAGIEYTDYLTCDVSKSSGEANKSGDFTLRFDSPFGRHKTSFSVGSEVIIYADETVSPTTILLTGILEKISFEGEGTYQSVTLTGRDYMARLQDTTVPPVVYTNSEISTIVTDIMLNNVPDIGITEVDVTAIILPRISFNHTTVFEAIKELADFCGYIFYVDNNKVLHFELEQTSQSGLIIDNTNLMAAHYDTTREGMANKIWVYGDRYLSGFQEIVSATGGSVFSLKYKPHDSYVEYLGSVQTGGIFQMTNTVTSGTNYLVSFEDKNLIFVSGTDIGYSSIPAIGGSILVNYSRDLPIVKYGQNNVSIALYGPKTKFIQDKSIKDPLTAVKILKTELENVDPLKNLEVDIKGWFNLLPGQTLQMTLNDLNISSLDVPIIEINYSFNANTIRTKNIIKLKLERKFVDITDKFTQIKQKLSELAAQDAQDTDVITRLEQIGGSVLVIGSHYNVFTRTINDSFIDSHPHNGMLGVPNSGTVGSLFSGLAWSNGIMGVGYDTSIDFPSGPNNTSSIGGFPNESGLRFNSGLSFTYSAWIYPRAIHAGSVVGIMGKNFQSAMQINPAGSIYFGVRSGATVNSSATVGGLSLNNWHHVAGVFTSGNLTVQSFVDGHSGNTTAVTVNFMQTSQFTIGGRSTILNSNGIPFNGYMDDVRVYNRALSLSEIGNLANKMQVNGSLLAYWKFDEGLGSFVYNSAISGDAGIQPFLGDRRGALNLVASGGYSY